MSALEDSTEFLIMEFEAMDMDGDGFLSRKEVFEMLIYQNVVLSDDEMQKQLISLDNSVNLSQFVTFMEGLRNSNRKVRDVFALFSEDGNRIAYETNILKVLGDLGIDNATEKVSLMESENNLVTYKGFARVYFQGKFS